MLNSESASKTLCALAEMIGEDLPIAGHIYFEDGGLHFDGDGPSRFWQLRCTCDVSSVEAFVADAVEEGIDKETARRFFSAEREMQAVLGFLAGVLPEDTDRACLLDPDFESLAV